MKKVLVFITLYCCCLAALYAQDTCRLRISLLTCSPGTELYSTFGHTAIRVQQLYDGSDEVYNYGTFEFSPDFYVQFIRGKLNYALSVENFADFTAAYQFESRSVVEQELQLSCAQKQTLYTALRINAQEANRYYRYDFLLDNCTTRARDMIARHAGGPVRYQNIIQPQAPTFRQLIHRYMNLGNQHWSKLGIDLLLGSRIDRKVNNKEAMFLPDNLLKALDGATVHQTVLASKARPVLTMPSALGKNSWFGPGVLLTLIALGMFIISRLHSKGAKKLTAVLDFLLFLLCGLAGVLLLFMWFGTDHYWCGNNFNLAWALPSHAVAAFVLHRKSKALRSYLRFVWVWLLILLLLWAFLPQQLNPALLPVVALLLYRSWSLSKT